MVVRACSVDGLRNELGNWKKIKLQIFFDKFGTFWYELFIDPLCKQASLVHRACMSIMEQTEPLPKKSKIEQQPVCTILKDFASGDNIRCYVAAIKMGGAAGQRRPSSAMLIPVDDTVVVRLVFWDAQELKDLNVRQHSCDEICCYIKVLCCKSD